MQTWIEYSGQAGKISSAVALEEKLKILRMSEDNVRKIPCH